MAERDRRWVKTITAAGMGKLHFGLLAVMVAFATVMVLINLQLSKRNRQLRAQLNAEFLREAIEDSPVSGWVLPPLKGHDAEGNPLEINLQNQGGKEALLVFSPSCGVCDENWPSWDMLTSNSEMSSRLLPITYYDLSAATISGNTRLQIVPYSLALIQELRAGCAW